MSDENRMTPEDQSNETSKPSPKTAKGLSKTKLIVIIAAAVAIVALSLGLGLGLGLRNKEQGPSTPASVATLEETVLSDLNQAEGVVFSANAGDKTQLSATVANTMGSKMERL